MPRYVAFLRAINVGGHVVTMERLRALFEALPLANVESFIASGNLIFESAARSRDALAAKIERQLESALGYEVATMLRTDAEVAAIATGSPFTSTEQARAVAQNVALLRQPAPNNAARLIETFSTEIDDFRLVGNEVYWLCRARQSESKFAYPKFEKLLGTPATWRGLKTMERLAAKYPPRADAPRVMPRR